MSITLASCSDQGPPDRSSQSNTILVLLFQDVQLLGDLLPSRGMNHFGWPVFPKNIGTRIRVGSGYRRLDSPAPRSLPRHRCMFFLSLGPFDAEFGLEVLYMGSEHNFLYQMF
ncbi:hypothetical protein SDJN02_05835, partial [Cucurbita argyrosperma subsp. argyrosperma]